MLGEGVRADRVPAVGEALERLQQALRPTSGDWPVFPSLHRPTLSRIVRENLADTGYDDTEIEKIIHEHEWLTLYRDQEFVPPALTTNGGRTVMRRVCEAAEISLDGEHDYLTPHGGRRGAGDVLYREDPVLAQTALRHRSIETTKDSYSYIEAGETASRAGDVFNGSR